MSKTEDGLKSLDLFEKFDTYCNVYSFASNNRAIYKYPLTYLKEFIFYFTQECHMLIRQAWDEKVYLPRAADESSFPILQMNKDIDADLGENFPLQRFYLLNDGDPALYLTKQEVICLEAFGKGNTAKEVARALNLSPRTVEQYMYNLKKKLKCQQLTQVIKIARKNNIIT